MSITGDLGVMIGALGHPFGDPQVLDAMTLVGLPTERSEFTVGPTKRVYYTADQSIADFLFEEDVLQSVIIQVVADDKHGAYPAPDSLIDGLSGTASRDDVLARFGTPVKSTDASDRFSVDDVFVRFGYVDDRVADITVMRTAPGQ
ncbi:hypothetical protein ACJ5H2_16965 [Nocardioides sp. R1-1]|uniref:hypothetical protein n=1 Tax=Nocardioides sp. R1-1 TaxID=3383502 RepID=UPI0038D18BF9